MVIIATAALYARGESDNEEGKSAIRETALDYIEGWYQGDDKRVERALHPDLTKRGVLIMKRTGKTFINFASASNMVEYTRAGMGKLKEGDIPAVSERYPPSL